MLRNRLHLPDGTIISSGAVTGNAIKSVTLTKCVNSEEELTLGSTCANMLEATLITPNGGLSLKAGDEVVLYKVNDKNIAHKEGVFILEKPTRPTAHTLKLTGYDRVTKLDKDLTDWLKTLNAWPYNILTFAEMICLACGLTFDTRYVVNRDYTVEKFAKAGITGRQLMKWIGEVCCCFFKANADGTIVPGWYDYIDTHAIGYKEGAIFRVYDDNAGNLVVEGVDVQLSTDDAGNVSITSDHLTVEDDGEGNVVLTVEDLTTLTYFQNGLSYEDYEVAPVDAVQIQLAEGDNAYRWPAAEEDDNCYIISGNPLLNSTSDTVAVALKNILDRLSAITYTPCEVSLPAVLDIQPGHIVRIVDRNGKSITMFVMTKKTTGQKDTYECTGSHRRDSTSVQNNPSASVIAQRTVDTQTQEDICKKLTNGGLAKAVFLLDGQLYVNADYIAAGIIKSENGKLEIDLSGESVPVFNTGISTNGLIVRGDNIEAQELVRVDAVTVDSKDTLRFLFCASDGRGVGAFSHMFNGTDQVGLQYRAYHTDTNGDRKSGVEINAGANYSGFYVTDGSGSVKGYFRVNELDLLSYLVAHLVTTDAVASKAVYIKNSEDETIGSVVEDSDGLSHLIVGKADFGIFGGKRLFWRPQDDGTFALMGRDE